MDKIKVVKRNGSIVDFDKTKIFNAIKKAVEASHADSEKFDASICNKLTNAITIMSKQKCESGNTDLINVEDIQDIVERTLIKCEYADTAKEYILYRHKRNEIRNTRDSISKSISELLNHEANSSDLKRDNGNIDGDSPMGTMLQIGSNVSKNYYLNNMISKDVAKAHTDGFIYIHDLDFYALTLTCCQIDCLKLFKGGFNTGHGHLREPNSIGSYATLAAIAIQSNQNDQHGGQAIPNFDYAMAPGIYKTFRKVWKKNVRYDIQRGLLNKDDFTLHIDNNNQYNYVRLENMFDDDNDLIESVLDNRIKEYRYDNFNKVGDCLSDDIKKLIDITRDETENACYQAMEGLVHNLNTLHSRAGAQVPFSSINLGTDTSNAGRMVTKNLLLAMEAGLGNGETAIFPIVIFKVKDGVNYEFTDPNHDLLQLSYRVTAKRLFPNYIFEDATFNKQYYKPGHPETEVACMGCRTRVMGNVYDPEREVAYGRGNLSFTTINLPMLALTADGNEDKFYELLDKYLELSKKQLLERFEIQAKRKVKNMSFLMGQGVWIDSDKLGPEDEIREVIKHGTMSIGFIGLAETLVALYGHHHGEGKEYWDKGYKIIKHIREYTDKISQEYKLNFSTFATPAEGYSGKSLKQCRNKFGIIKGVTDREYFTNSMHIPVYFDISAEEKIKLEAPFHELCNSGHICYIELDGDTTKNVGAIEAVVKCMHDNNIGYGAINHPVDRDPVCGYTGVINDECPCCHRKESEDGIKIERIRRITGYLVGSLDRWNDAKRAEEKDRVKHGI
jgi:ribonucleoside-triphosphate reductase